MNKRLKIRLYPTYSQKKVLENHFNAYRFCYNLCLEYKSTMWSGYKVSVSGYDMQAELFKIRKETTWLSLCKAECLRDAALNVDKAYKNFFKGKGFPKFKSKRGDQSFSANQNLSVKYQKLFFFGLKIKIKTSDHYQYLLSNHKIKQTTFKRDRCGNYWATCLVDIAHAALIEKTDKQVGLDFGIKELVITSDAHFFSNNQFLKKADLKIVRLQRRFAKTKKGGENRIKIQTKIVKAHQKATRQKEHYYHQITNQIIRENQTIVIESLQVKNMLKNRKLAKSISNASWGILTRMLEYKSVWNNRTLIKINTWFPSSKTCSGCGNKKEILLLRERVYRCDCCGLEIDRDLNAAINIRNEGIKIPGLPVEVAC